MRIYTLDPEDASDKTSILYAYRRGYTFKLDEDGSAEIRNPNGEVYHVADWKCDCPDSLGRDGGTYVLPDNRKVCKHVLYVAALCPCSDCNGYMVLRGHDYKSFTCCTPGCFNIRSMADVKAERIHRFRLAEQEADIDKVVNLPEPPEPEHTPEELSALLYG